MTIPILICCAFMLIHPDYLQTPTTKPQFYYVDMHIEQTTIDFDIEDEAICGDEFDELEKEALCAQKGSDR